MISIILKKLTVGCKSPLDIFFEMKLLILVLKANNSDK